MKNLSLACCEVNHRAADARIPHRGGGAWAMELGTNARPPGCDRGSMATESRPEHMNGATASFASTPAVGAANSGRRSVPSPFECVTSQVGHANSKMTMDVYAQLSSGPTGGMAAPSTSSFGTPRVSTRMLIGPQAGSGAQIEAGAARPEARKKPANAGRSPVARPRLELGTPRCSSAFTLMPAIGRLGSPSAPRGRRP
jgi:hypothetical protein